MQKANMSFGNNREPITNARQAAEALFAPKPEDEGQPLSDPGQPVAPRRPRVLPALSSRRHGHTCKQEREVPRWEAMRAESAQA
jgi:hypothetical protein